MIWLIENSSFIAAIATIIAIVVAVVTLRANHDWNRRRYAIGLLEDWNNQTAKHRKVIERHIPSLIDIDSKTAEITELSKQRAIDIYKSTPEDEKNKGDWELRFSLIQLLNYFEIISTAWYNEIGDQSMIEDTFRNVLIKYYSALGNYIEVVKDQVGYNPWEPYTDLINLWKQPQRNKREKTA